MTTYEAAKKARNRIISRTTLDEKEATELLNDILEVLEEAE